MEERFKELNITIPEVVQPIAAYVPAIRAGDLVFISGQLPIQEGKIVYQGKLGQDVAINEGKTAARICIINCLAALKSLVDLNSVEQIVKITGYINSAADFYEQAAVLNGASELLQELWQEKGRHARAAVGVNSLPLNAACEIEMIVKIQNVKKAQ